MSTYKIWTTRSLLVWAACAWLPFTGALAAMISSGSGGGSAVAALAVLAVAYITFRRHQQGKSIRDGITAYLGGGTRLVDQTAAKLRPGQVDAIARGLERARKRALSFFPAWEAKPYAIEHAHDDAFLIVRDLGQVRSHYANTPAKFRGLTYPDGTMVLEALDDSNALESLALHEGLHAICWHMNLDADCKNGPFAPLWYV